MPPQTKDKYGNYVKTDASGFVTASADPIGTSQNAPVQSQIAPTTQTTAQAPNVVPGAISGSAGGAINPPTPTKNINLTIPPSVPSDILAGAPTSGQVLSKAKSMADQYQEFLTQRQARQAELLKVSAPTEQETQLRQQLTDLNAQARQASLTSEERQAPMFAITGEQAAIERQKAIRGQALADQINALVDSRKVQIDALTSQMNFDKETMDAITNLSKLTQPDVLSTGVDKKTGEIYSLVKDPQTGEVTQNIVGRVTPEEAKLDYLKSYTDANGNEVASFMDPANNTIVNKILGKAQVKGGAGVTGGLGTGLEGLDINDPNYIGSLMSLTTGRKAPNQVETLRPIQKSVAVINQLSGLQESVDKTVTDPILGTLRQFNPYDFDARAIQAQLQAVVPNLARGVYGEVGVLTDQDIKNYIQTLPNIKGTKAQNDFVMAMTLKTVQRNLESQLETLASSGYDISGFKNQYQKVSNTVKSMEDKLGVTKQAQINISPEKTSVFDSVISQPAKNSYFSNLWNAITGK